MPLGENTCGRRASFRWELCAAGHKFKANVSTKDIKLGVFKQKYRLPRWLGGKESACHAEDTGDVGLIRGSGRFPGGGRGNPLQYSCLENSMDRGAWWATVHGVAKSRTRLNRLSTHTTAYLPNYPSIHLLI